MTSEINSGSRSSLSFISSTTPSRCYGTGFSISHNCSFQIADRSFRYTSPRLWNQLPGSFRQPRQSLDSPPHCQLISIIITTLIIHHSFTLSLQAQNLRFQLIFPTLDFYFYLLDSLHDNETGPDLSRSSFYF